MLNVEKLCVSLIHCIYMSVCIVIVINYLFWRFANAKLNAHILIAQPNLISELNEHCAARIICALHARAIASMLNHVRGARAEP